jgi:hypothetical protein
MGKLKQLRQSQEGMVSIVVTMIIMAVLSLIVLGFAQLARREQREALDKQLSTQAFYAAESGINDAIKAIERETNPYTLNKTTCESDSTTDPGSSTAFTDSINSSGEVAYTCLLIDQTPKSLEYSSIETDKSTVIPLSPVTVPTDPAVAPTPTDLKTLNISWNRSDNGGSGYYESATPDPNDDFPPLGSSGWDDKAAGILRIDITPLNKNGFTRNDLTQGTFTAFLYPTDDGTNTTPASVAYVSGAGSQGSVHKALCGNPDPPYFSRKCKVSITGLPTADISQYYVRIISIYSSSAVTISGDSNVVGQKVGFKGAQYVVDSTGKAGDILKRVRVHKPAKTANYKYPTFAIDSADSICKQLQVYPGGGDDKCTNPSIVTPTPAIP